MINSGSRFPPDHHALVIPHKTYLTEQMRKWPVMLDESSCPEEIKYPHSAMTNQVNISVNPHHIIISSCKDLTILLNLSHHNKCWLSPFKRREILLLWKNSHWIGMNINLLRTATDVLPYCTLNMCKLANYIVVGITHNSVAPLSKV